MIDATCVDHQLRIHLEPDATLCTDVRLSASTRSIARAFEV